MNARCRVDGHASEELACPRSIEDIGEGISHDLLLLDVVQQERFLI
jgi:hypothetical protein